MRIEAQAKAGELLREMRDQGTLAGRGDRKSVSQTEFKTLPDIGIDENQSRRWQQVASVPPPVRQEYVERAKADRDEVTTAGLLRQSAQPAPVS